MNQIPDSEILHVNGELAVVEEEQIDLILSMPAAKELAMWLGRQIQEFETDFGSIKTTHDIEHGG